jgi:Raf kinase inhibitor-like YbhB/YbcL family protein
MAVSPALSWTNAPTGTVEFVLIMNDPEPVRPALSVTGDILHWLVAKIPATTTSLPEGAGAADSKTLPAGARLVQPFRGPGAPAAGPRHHYTLTLYALNARWSWQANADRAAVMAASGASALARGIFNGRFMRLQRQRDRSTRTKEGPTKVNFLSQKPRSRRHPALPGYSPGKTRSAAH